MIQVQAPTWETVWMPYTGIGVTTLCGVEQLVDGDSKKYRAWAKIDEEGAPEPLMSDSFNACDEADIVYPPNRGMLPPSQDAIEAAMRQAADTRATMPVTSKSPKDMEEIARALLQEVREYYALWQKRQEEARAKQDEEAQDALFLARFTRALAKASPEQRATLAEVLLGDETSKQEKQVPRVSRKKERV